ncbi:MAG: hypothetical protein RSB52_01840 [Acidaminococcaceae bacterium]
MEKTVENIMELKYPHPHIKPQATYTDTIDEAGAIDKDLGYAEGSFSDARPYRIECWVIEQVVMATIYFSDRNIKTWQKEQLTTYLEQEKLVEWLTVEKNLQGKQAKDDLGIALWVVNIKLKDEKEQFAKLKVTLVPYQQLNE